jgi:hypothetical protein
MHQTPLHRAHLRPPPIQTADEPYGNASLALSPSPDRSGPHIAAAFLPFATMRTTLMQSAGRAAEIIHPADTTVIFTAASARRCRGCCPFHAHGRRMSHNITHGGRRMLAYCAVRLGDDKIALEVAAIHGPDYTSTDPSPPGVAPASSAGLALSRPLLVSTATRISSAKSLFSHRNCLEFSRPWPSRVVL